MKRREFLVRGAAVGAAAAAASSISLASSALWLKPQEGATDAARKLEAPAKGKVNVAFVLTRGAPMIDFAGPWEVFQDVHVMERGSSMEEMMPFRLYTVSDKTEPVTATGGMKILPDFTFANAPEPRVVVVPAQGGRSETMLNWLRVAAKSADVVMSVCTGAFVLGDAGLLAKKQATTHHEFFDSFAKKFPDVELKRGRRFVENDVISTAGGLTSGIDLALRVVERYFGRQVAEQTAEYMEYESKSWMV